METEREESDQLPEEAPAEQVHDDSSNEREGAKDSPGVPDKPDRATGHPEEE